MLVHIELATNQGDCRWTRVNDTITPGQECFQLYGFAPRRMCQLMFAATRKQDELTSLQFHGVRVRSAHEGVPFRHEMEDHGIASWCRKSPGACHPRAHQHQAVGTNRFQPAV